MATGLARVALLVPGRVNVAWKVPSDETMADVGQHSSALR